MSKAPLDVFPPSKGEDDLGWASSGIDYLFEVDAKTPADRIKLEDLQRRVSKRSQKPMPGLPPSR
ncbi:MAG TPA: hypothetical protein VIO62_03355 [Candidatus Dormibacteraeota bacterium]|jgi:hypothetical protein